MTTWKVRRAGITGWIGELEDHPLSRLPHKRAPATQGAVQDHCEDALDRVADLQMIPVLTRDIARGEQSFVVLGQAKDRLFAIGGHSSIPRGRPPV